MEKLLDVKPSSLEQLIDTISPAVYENLKQALEVGKWANGASLSKSQVEYCMQLIILYESKSVPEEKRTGKDLSGCKSQVEVLSVRPLDDPAPGEIE